MQQLIYDPAKSGKRMTIVCFISGSGTNYREIVKRNPEHDYLVFTNRPGCAGVAIGRGAFYDPWIFRRTDHYLRTGELLPEPAFAERVDVMRRHFARYCEFYGEAKGARFFRKVAPWYARRFGPAKQFRQRIVAITSRADFETVLADYQKWRGKFCDEHGELLAKYRAAPLAASFLRGPGETVCGAAVAVPKGPVENW